MILDFGGGFSLRRATADDHEAFCAVCLKTGDAGQDATWREDEPDLMGLIYAVPYRVLEPDFAFAIEGPTGVAGYLFGVPDTASFNARLAAVWYPALRGKVRDPGPDEGRWRGSDWARRMVHHPDLVIPHALRAYPSHGHIDLLPEARGGGIGRQCMTHMLERITAAGSTGMYLDVHPMNTHAQAFYRRLGFEVLREEGLPKTSAFMVRRFG